MSRTSARTARGRGDDIDALVAKVCFAGTTQVVVEPGRRHDRNPVELQLSYCGGGSESSRRQFHAENYYSVSHSTVATVLAISRAPIGVDIEQRIVNECLPDMVWALSAGEREEIRAEGGGNVLTEIWTAKEAAGKALGVGLLAMPSGFVSRAVPGMPSVRTVSVPATVADRTSVETCGVWIGDHHLRVAWGAVPEGG